MIVSQFEAWAQTASPPNRADGVSALARAYLYSSLDVAQRRDAVRALTSFLDDASPLVRRAMADAFASAAEAPHHIILALAEDIPSVATIVLGRSPILSDAELADCAIAASDAGQSAIAGRLSISAGLAAALVEVCRPEALAVLAANQGAQLADVTLRRLMKQHGTCGDIREALLARGGLPIDVHAQLVAMTAGALSAFVAGQAWLPAERIQRVTREAAEKATVAIAAGETFDHREAALLASHLRTQGRLTIALTFRSLLSGNLTLFNATLCELTGMSAARVAGLTVQFDSAGFTALYRKAGFPLSLLPAFRIALGALLDRDEDVGETQLSAELVAHVRAECTAINDGQFDDLLVLLRRYEAEAVREEVRATQLRRSADAPAMAALPAPSRADADERLLVEIAHDEAVPMARAMPIEQPTPARFTIDMAAIEAELLAA